MSAREEQKTQPATSGADRADDWPERSERSGGRAMRHEDLNERFEQQRARLHAVAFRILGSASDADDAVQEAWLRFARTDVSDVVNLDGWLTTVVARVCLTMLQSRKTRREAPLDGAALDAALDTTEHRDSVDPADEAVLAESVGRAMLVVLDTLSPAE